MVAVFFGGTGGYWYPISGEIHLARVPAAEWREQLLRMKAGGLNASHVRTNGLPYSFKQESHVQTNQSLP
jgi:beta-galactosidase GanA